MTLTRISLTSFLLEIGKQHSPRCDAAKRGVPSGAILFAYRGFHLKMEFNFKIIPAAPKNESGLTQLITMGESIRHIWVKFDVDLYKLLDLDGYPLIAIIGKRH